MNAVNPADIENKSLEELVSLNAAIEDLIKKKRKENTRQIRSQMNELAKVAGFESLEDFIQGQGTRQERSDKGVKLPPKYRNPQNPDQTWSGKGPTPKWLQELIDNGKNKEWFRIDANKND